MCNVCRGRKHQSQFAGRQLSKFSSYNKACWFSPSPPNTAPSSYALIQLLTILVLRDPNSVKVTCKDCTAQQTTKLTCCVCSETKLLDGFAKSQRKNPDQARCKDCVNKDLETEPNIAPSSDESGSAELSEPDSDFDVKQPPSL